VKRALAIAFALCLLPLRVAADDLSPKQIYLRALATMHALPNSAYLQFAYDWWQITNDSTRTRAYWNITLQTSTGVAHMVRQSDGKVVDEPFVMRPDVLLSHPAPSTSPNPTEFQLGVDVDPAEKLPTIAVVVARAVHYDVTLIGLARAAPGCTRAYHLKLVPNSHRERDNLRELWVDTSSFRVCKAVAIWNGGVVNGKVFPVTFTLVFDSNGLISTWSADGSVGPKGEQAHYIASGSYENPKHFNASPIDGWP
jgi:hypothetical protein